MYAYGGFLPGEQRFQDQGQRRAGGGPGFNIQMDMWEEPDVEEKERLLGFQVDDTATPGVTSTARAIRIRRALDATTMRWLGAFLHASQA